MHVIPHILLARCEACAQVTNPSPKTQVHLARVSIDEAHFVDQGLRDVVARLLGKHVALSRYNSHLDNALPTQLSAWSGMCNYLMQRIQSEPEQCPGRRVDMSPMAAIAMKIALTELLHHVNEIRSKINPFAVHQAASIHQAVPPPPSPTTFPPFNSS